MRTQAGLMKDLLWVYLTRNQTFFLGKGPGYGNVLWKCLKADPEADGNPHPNLTELNLKTFVVKLLH